MLIKVHFDRKHKMLKWWRLDPTSFLPCQIIQVVGHDNLDIVCDKIALAFLAIIWNFAWVSAYLFIFEVVTLTIFFSECRLPALLHLNFLSQSQAWMCSQLRWLLPNYLFSVLGKRVSSKFTDTCLIIEVIFSLTAWW